MLLPLVLLASATLPTQPVREVDEATMAALIANPTGQVMVVNFFATWCGPCVSELPRLEATLAAHPGVAGLLVSLDDADDGPRLTRFVLDHGVTLPIVHLVSADPGAAVARLVSAWPDRIPVTLIVAPGGQVHTRFIGGLVAAELDAALTVRDALPSAP